MDDATYQRLLAKAQRTGTEPKVLGSQVSAMAHDRNAARAAARTHGHGAAHGSDDTATASTAAPTTTTASATTTAPAPDQQIDRSQAVHPGEELLTGDTAARVKAAAEAAVTDGTVDRVETDAEGSAYEAHMTKADGTHVTVKVDESFSVTTVETDQGPPQGAPGGPRGQAPAASGNAA